ncbi:MAG: Nramp family divalent metal transporter [Isosphaeraceae bacterium]|nr:Nramp family divalent metal transporter [Isosphaeraceae bacterium]
MNSSDDSITPDGSESTVPAVAAPEFDAYALPADAIEDPPTSLWKALGRIGPGLILAGSIVGTGELIATTGLGAEQGYVLLWLILVSCVIKVFVQVELGRYAITHGKTTLAAFDTLPGPRLGTSWMGWLWLFMMLTTQAQIAAMEGLVGQAADMAFPSVSNAVAAQAGKIDAKWGEFLAGHKEHFWATLTGLAAIVLLISGGYKRLEHITTFLVALVTLITVACVLGLPFTEYPVNWDEMATGFAFTLPASGLALAFSAFGITGVGASELFAYPYWCIEKGYARSTGPREPGEAWGRRARGWLRVMQLDAWFSMVVFTVATVAFYLLGAAVLHPQGLDPKGPEMIATLSSMYVKPLGVWTREVFLIGAWAVLFKTLYVATAANSRLTADFLELTGIWKTNGPRGRDRVVKAFCVVYPVLALALYFVLREPKLLVAIGGSAQALMLPLIAGATIFLRQRDADRRSAPIFFTDILVWIAFFSLSAFAIYYMYDLVNKNHETALRSFDALLNGVRRLLYGRSA